MLTQVQLGGRAAIAWEGDYMNLLEQVPQPPDSEYRIIPLSQGKVAFVDIEDYERISQHKWWAYRCAHSKTFYARRWAPGKTHVIHMHREIIGAPPELFVDHWDGYGLNNRRYNLRPATRAQNNHNQKKRSDNTSGYKGVSVFNQRGVIKWRAQIVCDGKSYNLGLHMTPEEASSAYIEAAKRLHGEFARW